MCLLKEVVGQWDGGYEAECNKTPWSNPYWRGFVLGWMVVVLAPFSASASPTCDPRVVGELNRIVQQFDGNGSKTLERDEQRRLVAYIARERGKGASLSVERVLGDVDFNRDGRITLPEWQRLTRWADGRCPSRRFTEMLQMRDATPLATDVHLPLAPGKYPVILARTPYGRRCKNDEYTIHSYAFVIQDQRGRFDSKGQNFPFIGCGWEEWSDGKDTVDWILKQPWSNGKIGTMGGSALGITQILMAPTQPRIAAQYIEVAAASLYHHAAYVGGAFRKSQVENWVTGNKYDPESLKEMKENPNYGPYWERFDSLPKAHRANVPGVHVGGWFDTFSQGQIDAFVARQHKGGAGAKGRQKLVMGPWVHGLDRKPVVGEMIFPNAARPKLYTPDAWFNHWLHGEKNGVGKSPAVAYYVMGDLEDSDAPGNEWRYADDWPIKATSRPMYLTLSSGLSEEIPDTTGYQVINFDPSNPCPTKGGCNLCIPSGCFDQSKVERRPDVLTFTTDALSAPVEVTGNVRAVLYVSSSAVDTDLSVRMSDVYPDGRSYLMAEGMLRLRFRNSFRQPEPLKPGDTYKVTVNCWATSIVFNHGHRIRIAVTSSNYPRFDINPGTGKPYVEGDKVIRQRNRIYCGKDHPSHVLLPVVR